tara:strand:+ start:19 stop:798 length:780 start_codon:yes stop_codon:yes gene_type:complete
MRFSILINCHNQANYIDECILSSLNQDYKNFEVIVVDSSNKKLNLEKFKSYENLKYFHVEKFFKYPEINQMYKVELGLKEASGDYICLLDGDDKFSHKKLIKLEECIKNNDIVFNQDIPFLFNKDGKKKNLEIKKYKQNNIFRNLIINWPQVYGTSSITIKKSTLENFFNNSDPYKWKYLAIDVQLILFCSINFKIHSQLNQITFKRKHDENLGDIYLNTFSKIFWKRRKCQHDFYYFVKKKRTYNLDYIVTSIVSIFF